MYKSYKSIHGNDKSQEPPLIWPPLVGSTTIFAFAALGLSRKFTNAEINRCK